MPPTGSGPARPPGKPSASKSPYQSNVITGVTFSVGSKSGSTIVVTLTLRDPVSQKLLSSRGVIDFYLSTSSTGDNYASAASGGFTAGSNGTVIPVVTGVVGKAVSKISTGTVDISITDAGTRNLYLVVILPDGSTSVSPVLAF